MVRDCVMSGRPNDPCGSKEACLRAQVYPGGNGTRMDIVPPQIGDSAVRSAPGHCILNVSGTLT